MTASSTPPHLPHPHTQDEELIALFGDAAVAPELAAGVEAVRVVRDGATNIGKGFAFVLFKTKASGRRGSGPIGNKGTA